MKKLKRGVLVTFEGIDGSGKTTLFKNIATQLASTFSIIVTKESGGTPVGAQMHAIVQYPPYPLDPKAEYLLFAADRAQHVAQIVGPALLNNQLVLCDRMGDSSVVYQGYARGLDISMIEHINTWAMNNIEPDLTFFVRIDPQIGLKRFTQRAEKLSTFESEQKTFRQKVAQGYEHYFAHKQRVIVLDGTKQPEELAQEAHNILLNWLKDHNLIS